MINAEHAVSDTVIGTTEMARPSVSPHLAPRWTVTPREEVVRRPSLKGVGMGIKASAFHAACRIFILLVALIMYQSTTNEVIQQTDDKLQQTRTCNSLNVSAVDKFSSIN